MQITWISKETSQLSFFSIKLSLFLYSIEVRASAVQKKYLDRINKFFQRAYRYGYILTEYKMSELIEERNRILFHRILGNPGHNLDELLPTKRHYSS